MLLKKTRMVSRAQGSSAMTKILPGPPPVHPALTAKESFSRIREPLEHAGSHGDGRPAIRKSPQSGLRCKPGTKPPALDLERALERSREYRGLPDNCVFGGGCVIAAELDAARDVGEIEPDFDAAEVGAFGADGRGDAGAEMAGRADVASEFGVDFAELGDFVHGGLVDFFLGVEAGAHGPFMQEMEERAGFEEADGFGVGKKIESDFRRNAAVEEFVF